MSGRAFPLSLWVVILALMAAPLAAHPLPGTTLVLSGGSDRLTLTIAIPLRELDLAMPGGSGLGDTFPDGALDAAATARLGGYVDDHLSLTAAAGAELVFTVTSAHVEEATHEHVGRYDLVQLDLSVPMAAGQTVFPLTLHYDAVMHEVRNHEAAVYLQAKGQATVGLAIIQLDPETGRAAPLVIPAAP